MRCAGHRQTLRGPLLNTHRRRAIHPGFHRGRPTNYIADPLHHSTLHWTLSSLPPSSIVLGLFRLLRVGAPTLLFFPLATSPSPIVMGNVAGDPPCVTVRPFRVSPPEAAAADTAAAVALFRGGMADVAAGGEAAGMNAEDAALLGAAVRRWAEATATTDLADIRASYALPPPPSTPKEVDGEATGAALEGGEGERSSPPPSSSSPHGYFFLAVDVSSGRVLGCVGGKPPKAVACQPAGAARAEVNSTGGSGDDAYGNGGPPAAAPTPDGTGGGASAGAGAPSGGGACNDQADRGTDGGGGKGAQPPPPQLSVELVRMAVATDARRQGVGRALVAALHAAVTSDGVGRVHLSTLSTMVSAMHLYAATGYKETSRVPLSQAESGLEVPSSVVRLVWEGTSGEGIEP